MTNQEKQSQLEAIEQDRIYLYHLTEAEKEIRKGNENIKVLYNLLVKEIHLHNGVVTKKSKKVRSLPTSD